MTGFQSERVWLLIFATLVLDGLAGLAGGLLSERWLARHQAGLIGFAAGALLGAVFGTSCRNPSRASGEMR